MVESYLKIFTFLTPTEITEVVKKHNEEPHLRIGQKTLAREIITDLHGKEEYDKAVKISESLFSGDVKNLNLSEIEDGFKDVPNFLIEREENIIDFLVNNNVCSSKREAREFVSAGSISINGDKIINEEEIIDKTKAIENKIIIVRRGKKKYYMGKFNI